MTHVSPRRRNEQPMLARAAGCPMHGLAQGAGGPTPLQTVTAKVHSDEARWISPRRYSDDV